MPRQRTSGGRTAPSDQPPVGRPLRRATDPTLVLGPARPLTAGAALAAIAGCALALLGSAQLAPVAFALSSVVAVGLLAGARRTDILTRSDSSPDRSSRTRRVLVGIIGLAVVGSVWSAWTITAEWAR